MTLHSTLTKEKTFEEILIVCIEYKITLYQYFVLYSIKSKTPLYNLYKDVNGYEGKLLSKIMIDDLKDKEFLIVINNKLIVNENKINII